MYLHLNGLIPPCSPDHEEHNKHNLTPLYTNYHLHTDTQVVDHEQFEDARTLLSAAALVYERSTDQARLSKVNTISSLVTLVENASGALDAGRYADAEGLVAECLGVRAALAVEQPLCLRPPDCVLFQGGEDGAKTAVLLRVRAAGDADRASALELLESGEFEAAERAASSACKRFKWWVDHHQTRSNSNGGDEKAVATVAEAPEEEGCLDHDRRQGVLRAAEELMASITAAARKAQAEGLTLEGRQLKSTADFAMAVKTLKCAAALFQDAGLAHAAAETRAEAARTEAEALLLTSAGLHGEGKFDTIAEHLQKAEGLLLEATKEAAGSGAVGGGDAVAGSSDNNGSELSSHTPRSPEAPEQGGAGAGASCHLFEDLVNLRSRVVGDIVMRGVAPALDAREYDQGLRLMLEAEDHYAAIGPGKWTTSVASAISAAAGKELTFSSAPPSPKELVTKRAALDGDRLRAEAASAIQKEKNPVKARELLSGAEACMAWAGVDPFGAGAAAVSKDIKVFESRAEGDKICNDLVALLRDRNFERAKVMLEEALIKYRQV